MESSRWHAPSGALAAIVVCLAGGTWACTSGQAPNDVTIVGLDYAFEAPDTLPAGPTVFAFENRGEVAHEVILVRLKEGVSMDEIMRAVREGAEPGDFTEGGPGILIADPGETAASRLLVDLVPGRTYALICNFRDEPDHPPHTELGMRGSFEVAREG